MARTIADIYREGHGVYVALKPFTPTRKRPSALSLLVSRELAEMLFKPIPSSKKGHLLVANKLKARDAIRLIASSLEGC